MVRHLYRVTDTCIPEDVAVLPLEKALLDEWQRAKKKGKRRFPARIPLPDPACWQAQDYTRSTQRTAGC